MYFIINHLTLGFALMERAPYLNKNIAGAVNLSQHSPVIVMMLKRCTTHHSIRFAKNQGVDSLIVSTEIISF